MRKWMSLFAIVLMLACAKGSETPVTKQPSKPRGKAKVQAAPEMPPYKATYLDGSEFDLQSKKGTVVLVNLWATWCGPCRHEIPELEKIHAKYSSQGFAVVGISLGETAETVNDFLKARPIQYPIVLDREERMSAILNVSVLPTSVIVDRSGRMVWRSVGIVSAADQEMIKVLEAALKGSA